MYNLCIGVNLDKENEEKLITSLSKYGIHMVSVTVESIKVIDLETLDIFDISLNSVAENEISIENFNINDGYCLALKGDKVVDEDGFIKKLINFGRTSSFAMNRSKKWILTGEDRGIVAFYNNRYIKVNNYKSNAIEFNSSDGNNYMQNRFRVDICLETLDTSVYEYGFCIYGSGEEVERKVKAIYVDTLYSKLKSLITLGNNVFDCNDLVCIAVLKSKHSNIILKNTFETVILRIGTFLNGCLNGNIVIPPSVKNIVIDGINKLSYFDIGSLNVFIPKVNSRELLHKLWDDNSGIRRLFPMVSYDYGKLVSAMSKKNFIITTY